MQKRDEEISKITKLPAGTEVPKEYRSWAPKGYRSKSKLKKYVDYHKDFYGKDDKVFQKRAKLWGLVLGCVLGTWLGLGWGKEIKKSQTAK